jgi:two-component system NtrC family sensor kinase
MYGNSAEMLYANPEDRRRYLAQLERDTYVRDYELKFRRKDGNLMDCMITSSIHPSVDGREYYIQGSIHDITERKRMEAKLKEVQKMEVIGRIASGVAHEVRNPLNAILAISEALCEEIGDREAYKPYLDHICTQVDRLSTLMNDLLELGKPLKTTEFAPVPVLEICASAVALWSQSDTRKEGQVLFTDQTAGERLLVHGNSSKLKQVILNLLENASQHTPEGGDIELKLLRSGANRVIMRVTDHGPGIPKELMAEVFKPFFTTRARGSGLGLSIVKNIVETHGGVIELFNNESPPGLTVDVTLPIFKEVADEA